MDCKLATDTALQIFLHGLGLEQFLESKLTLKEVLYIGSEACTKIEPLENVFGYYLQKLFALNVTVRALNSKDIEENDDCEDFKVDDLFEDNESVSNSINPLDVVCALLHCSDRFLQQEIIRKMAFCQFAVPLILPAGDESDGCTFMLWAMRAIEKKWKPRISMKQKGYKEESIVELSLPMFSFVRLGEHSLSKSKILNQILSPEEHLHDFFLHRDSNGGNVKRKVANGLVEITWYFPPGQESDVFQDPITILNLRGDLQCHKKQFTFLTKISKTLFIFIENNNEDSQSFKDINLSCKNYFFIISLQPFKNIEGTFRTFLEKLSKVTNKNYLFTINKLDKNTGGKNVEYLSQQFSDINRRILSLNPKMSQEKQIVRRLQLLIQEQIMESQHSFEKMDVIAYNTGMAVDEDCNECKNTKTRVQQITKCITDVVTYKKETMKLQGDFWKQLAECEKELCQMRKQGNLSGQDYKSQLNKKIFVLRRQQIQQKLPDGIIKFIDALTKKSADELTYFTKWMRFKLESISRNSILNIQQTKETGSSQTLSERNLGTEHFIRELGQFYEAECLMVSKKISKHKQFHHLPEIAADLLLGGFPLELLDGDTSNIPLQWITDVLEEVNIKTGRQFKMRVISVLGVQSSGKSTLLNTMFGLQFPVGSGRCTRGAFMTLLNVKEDFQEELGCHFILVIDTEGLRPPEMFSAEEKMLCHDNELATLVIGLSDIAVVNMSMENTAEMKETLQIAVHAFLRMKEIGKKPRCQFVHQNVSDVSAHNKLMREKHILLEHLDVMTRVAGKLENNTNIKKFSDIIDYDIEKDNWYIPGLWHGVPPMASVSTGYSENVYELKMHLLEILKQKPKSDDSCNIKEFIEWIQSLWNAVKHEKFVFSFRSSLVADAYNQLCVAYSEQEWQFRKEAHHWMIKTENRIKNQMSGEEPEIPINFEEEIDNMLQSQQQKLNSFLMNYFKKDDKHVRLVEKYKEDFMASVSQLKTEVAGYLKNKCKEVLLIQKVKSKIRSKKGSYQERIEEQVGTLLGKYGCVKRKLSDKELESEFLEMWNKTLEGFNLSSLTIQDINSIMLEHLMKDMRNKASYINEILSKLQSLRVYQEKKFTMKIDYFEGTEFQVIKKTEEIWDEATNVAINIMDRCKRCVMNIITRKEDYNEIFCQQILDIVNNSLQENYVKKFEFKPLFEMDLKLFILARAAPKFQKMHNEFIQENDPKLYLEKLKPVYLETFKNGFIKNDDSAIRAKRFCELCLKPALIDYLFSRLGHSIVDDILASEDLRKQGSKTFFRTAFLTDLLKNKVFNDYVKYCLQYEMFAKDWITAYITTRYNEPGVLNQLICSCLNKTTLKIRDVLKKELVLKCTQLSESLKVFCDILKNDLFISQNDMEVVIFPDTANVHQFFQHTNLLLDDIKVQIQNELNTLDITVILSEVTIKPQEELFRKVFGCGQQCPFCNVPCEAGGADHSEHFASIHRPQGLGKYKNKNTQILCHELCTTNVVSNTNFECKDTEWKPYRFKEYERIYPGWRIKPDPSTEASMYWKYVFKEFNYEFAKRYNARLARLPEDWYSITESQAYDSITSKSCI